MLSIGRYAVRDTPPRNVHACEFVVVPEAVVAATSAARTRSSQGRQILSYWSRNPATGSDANDS